jgi:hypothetical protein
MSRLFNVILGHSVNVVIRSWHFFCWFMEVDDICYPFTESRCRLMEMSRTHNICICAHFLGFESFWPLPISLAICKLFITEVVTSYQITGEITLNSIQRLQQLEGKKDEIFRQSGIEGLRYPLDFDSHVEIREEVQPLEALTNYLSRKIWKGWS